MTPKIYEGVTIDACPRHGVWLDMGVMPRIASRIRSGSNNTRRYLIERARREGKVSGMVLGGWSLLLD